ncbi:MucR family transcriptional regulator [Methylobacterium sp. WSM2598]|uniref:MucR family transcriptional regulator n=1 Tax=Methylobacterium sp. WSM2598 TaxID=398261 RepID=UPI00035F88B1|nr:MucR family transcriptional regulator [Methylobacterium sp. WSM2598]
MGADDDKVGRPDPLDLMGLASDLVSAYSRLTAEIVSTCLERSLSIAGFPAAAQPDAPPQPERPVPPVPIESTVTPEHIVSLENGKPYRSLKRHLAARGLTPEQYRAKWGLPPDYPMTAAASGGRPAAGPDPAVPVGPRARRPKGRAGSAGRPGRGRGGSPAAPRGET